jgi:hypothetical protein
VKRGKYPIPKKIPLSLLRGFFIATNKFVVTMEKNNSISVPIITDSILEFKCSFRKAKVSVRAGESRELKLEFNGCNLFFWVNSNVIAKMLTGGLGGHLAPPSGALRRGALITPSEQRLSLALRRARLIA